MTIETLVYQRPQFPNEVRSRIAEMVTARPERKEVSKDTSPITVFIPKVKYVAEVLALFKRTENELAFLNSEDHRIRQLIRYIRSVSQLVPFTEDPDLVAEVNRLNTIRTGFIEQLFKGGILADEYLSAIKTLHMDIAEIVQGSKWLGAGVFHPATESNALLLAETYENLEKAKTLNYHKHFDLHCPILRRKCYDESLLPELGEIVPTSGSELSWVDLYTEKNEVIELRDYIPTSLTEGVNQIQSMLAALNQIPVTDKTVQHFLNEATLELSKVWDRVVEQSRLLAFIVEQYLNVTESSGMIYERFLNLQIQRIEDPSLLVAIGAKLKPSKESK